MIHLPIVIESDPAVMAKPVRLVPHTLAQPDALGLSVHLRQQRRLPFLSVSPRLSAVQHRLVFIGDHAGRVPDGSVLLLNEGDRRSILSARARHVDKRLAMGVGALQDALADEP